AEAFDLVVSSLALHYVGRFDRVCRNVHRWLARGGSFVLSVEHPVFTARPQQDWHYGPDGERLHWPVDDYLHEGLRRTSWMADDVIKYQRTLASYLNGLIEAGFRIGRILEPGPSPEVLAGQPEARDECRRPMFLLIAADKAAA